MAVLRETFERAERITVDEDSPANQLMLRVEAPFLGNVSVVCAEASPEVIAVIAPCFPWGALDSATVAAYLANEYGPLGILLDGDQLCLGTAVSGQADGKTVEWLVRHVAAGTDAVFKRFSPSSGSCLQCGSEVSPEVRFCGDCGAPVEVASEEEGTPSDPNLIGAGTYIVGDEIEPGLYRVSGYYARLDAHHSIIGNGSARSGLELVRIHTSDAYVEVNGEAMKVALLPSVDPIAAQYRDGTYLAGPDIAPGRYRVSDPGGTAFAFVKNRDLAVSRSESNGGSVIITLTNADFALEYSGLLERV
ncbi:MAG: zinc ribbon domain-containing protein [Candidatus Nanopelagicales bacterium]|nr:zinc ribbon domain-containing protein [Candidatus Nanopelagicales bacterium]MCF8537181.1 zinc ribbon domain-containing protein [Candidatus Nanopelagicales bacterium]MCF8543071.1 zinc ribbon domain-containing protein [Candidatus Nanopelagicales bacterium]